MTKTNKTLKSITTINRNMRRIINNKMERNNKMNLGKNMSQKKGTKKANKNPKAR